MDHGETKRIISLKDIPPLDPSSIPPNSSLKARALIVPVTVANQRCEEKSTVSFSNILIDPNSTRSMSIAQENNKLVPEPQQDNSIPKSKEESKKGSAKSVLHEICASKRWRPPVYECCKVEGPCHMRLFTYRLLVEIRDSSGNTVLECFGDPKRNKKAAAEHAAEGALWYLENVRRNQTKLHK